MVKREWVPFVQSVFALPMKEAQRPWGIMKNRRFTADVNREMQRFSRKVPVVVWELQLLSALLLDVGG